MWSPRTQSQPASVHTDPENGTFTKQETQGSLSSPETVPGTSKFCWSASQDRVCGTGAAADRHTCLVGVRQKTELDTQKVVFSAQGNLSLGQSLVGAGQRR